MLSTVKPTGVMLNDAIFEPVKLLLFGDAVTIRVPVFSPAFMLFIYLTSTSFSLSIGVPSSNVISNSGSRAVP